MSIKKKVYLAGPITGYHSTAPEAFAKGKKQLEELGFEVYNPIEEVGLSDSYREAFKKELNWIMDNADAIGLLPGWENSKGVRCEKALAECLKLMVIIL